ncbi:MAG: GTPase [Candidatus Woesearchaeota archaeon]
MNFQNLVPVERSKTYLDLAFRKAREKVQKKLTGDFLQRLKKKESIKLDVVKDQLVTRLEGVLNSFPSMAHLPSFYHELLKLTLDYGELKKSLGAVNWAVGKVRIFHKEYVRKISRCEQKEKISQTGKEFYGRISSVVKQIDSNLAYLQESRKIMRGYPDIKEMPTIVIFGFPNVGKTTLLNKLTGSKGKVAEYSFTTQGVNSGFITSGEKKIQFLDVPGSLSRLDKMNNIEKIAYLTVKELADKIIYVFDLSGAGYDFEQQEKLYQLLKNEYGKDKKILVYVSKTDITPKETIAELKIKHLSFAELNKEILE